jgi:hypothetical protein
MTKKFLTSKEVFVVKGYLSSSKDNVQPIGNSEFIKAQQAAEYIVTFAEMAKNKDFKGKEADNLAIFKLEVEEALSKKGMEYIKAPKKVVKKLTKQLADEALAFINYEEKVEETKKVNDFLQRFNIINEFEEIGLFWEEEIVKIDKIYTIKEITEAVQSCINLL